MSKNENPAMSLCKKYIPARKRIFRNKKEIEEYRKKLETEISVFERMLLEDCIALKEQEMEEDHKSITLFETAVQLLESDEKELILRMYGDGAKWTEVLDKDGETMHPQKIARLRKKALAHIQEFLDQVMDHMNHRDVAAP